MNFDPTECGSLGYMAPEVLSRKNIMANLAIDIWAMGVILYELLHGYLPFKGASKHERMEKIVKGVFVIDPVVRASTSEECLDLLQRMLTVDYEQRINIFHIVRHPWILGEKLEKYAF